MRFYDFLYRVTLIIKFKNIKHFPNKKNVAIWHNHSQFNIWNHKPALQLYLIKKQQKFKFSICKAGK